MYVFQQENENLKHPVVTIGKEEAESEILTHDKGNIIRLCKPVILVSLPSQYKVKTRHLEAV